MKRRSVLSLLLVLCMMVGMMVPAHAAGTVLRVDVPEKLPAAGETFEVIISLSGNPGLGAMQFTLVFDDAVLDCTNMKNGEVLKGTLSASNPNAKEGAKVAAASMGAISDDGTVVVCTFKVLKGGDPAFSLKDAIMSTVDGDKVNFASNLPESAKPAEKPEQKPGKTPAEDEEGEEREEETTVSAPSFSDVSKTHWAFHYVEKAAEMGLIGGYSDGTFRPGNQVTRAQFVTMLWRMAGKPASSGKTPFTDIGGINAEFRKAIAWAYENGYIGGRTATTFAPSDTLTRQAAMKVLFLYSGGRSGQETMFTQIYDDEFTDSGSLSDWAKQAMYWAVYNELISGTTPNTLGAAKTATRGQLAKILVNYSEVFGI